MDGLKAITMVENNIMQPLTHSLGLLFHSKAPNQGENSPNQISNNISESIPH